MNSSNQGPGRAPSRIGVTIALMACLACTRGEPAGRDTAIAMTEAATAACLVDSASIGGVRLGMTLDEVRRSLPAARLERMEDGDGVQLVSVTVDSARLVSLYAGEDEPAIDWTKRVEVIETFHPGCSTADGVRPGALVRDLEPVLGAVTRIVVSEIESRQFISFQRQPAWLTLRLDYTGIFPEGSVETTRYRDGARIFSIGISSH